VRHTRSLLDIVFIGAGNVATHLCKLLSKYYTIRQVFSRTEQSASALAETVSAGWTTSKGSVDYSSGAYIFCVPDNQLVPVLESMNFKDQLLIHTSGSVPLNILKTFSSNCGVLYPVQTFSKERPVDLQEVPVCIEANSMENERILMELASHLSRDIHVIDSEKRMVIHIAAVIACNFANHMFARAEGIMDANQLDFDLLKPLIRETADKRRRVLPVEMIKK